MRVLLSRAVGLISRNRRKKERLTTRKSTESKDASGSRKWGKLLVSSVVFSTAVENSVEKSWIRAEVFFSPFTIPLSGLQYGCLGSGPHNRSKACQPGELRHVVSPDRIRGLRRNAAPPLGSQRNLQEVAPRELFRDPSKCRR